MTYVVDAHTLIWYLEGSAKLAESARSAIDTATAKLVIPAIALAEALHVVGRQRTELNEDDLWTFVERDANVSVATLDAATVKRSTSVPLSDIHDRLIVATTLLLAESVSDCGGLITFDREIHESRLVKIVW